MTTQHHTRPATLTHLEVTALVAAASHLDFDASIVNFQSTRDLLVQRAAEVRAIVRRLCPVDHDNRYEAPDAACWSCGAPTTHAGATPAT